MSTKKRMIGDLIFDHKCKVNSRVVYCDPDTEMITRTDKGDFEITDISSMSKELFDNRFEIIHTLFDTEPPKWNLPRLGIDIDAETFYAHDASIIMKRKDGKIELCEELQWRRFSSDGSSPIIFGVLYMKIPDTSISVTVPLSDIVDRHVDVYVNGNNMLECYYSDEKIMFLQNNILNSVWRNGVLNDGISMIPCEYKWCSENKIAIRKPNEPEYNIQYLRVEEFCGKNPKYVLWFE